MQRLVKEDVMDVDLMKYLVCMIELVYQRMIYIIRTKKVLSDSTYKDF